MKEYSALSPKGKQSCIIEALSEIGKNAREVNQYQWYIVWMLSI